MSELFDKSIRTLELPRVLQLLSEQAVSPEAKELALAVRPETDYEDVLRLLDQTDGARAMIVLRGAPGFSGVKPVKDLLDRADRGGSLNIPELIRIGDLLYAVRRAKEYFNADAAEPTALDQIFLSIHGNRFLEDKIRRCISDENTVADAASPELADIRRHMRAALAKSRQILQKIISSPSYSKVLQDNIITQRDGRFVVPVKADQKGNLPGLIHDVSSTGATVFVEPMGVVQANNEYAELQAKEQAEIDRILAELSADAAAHRRDIQWDHDALVQLDLIFARGELSYKMDAIRPQVRRDGLIRLRKARHPLLDKKTAVPIDIELGGAFDTLVITGPNTGGKTVSLKTLGLLTLMTQCGLHIPAGDRSEVSVYERVLADIGDEQSIEQSLSTFSAHMKTIVEILQEADRDSLILFDELGAGTDPVEGAALAIAILERLRDLGARVIATTHYAELKAYAIHTPGVENGSCEFDVATLRPTYRLLIGVPGRSNAFAISERLGMDAQIVDRARELVSGDNRRLEDVVSNLEERRQALEQELADAQAARSAAQAAGRDAEKQLAELEKRKEQEMEKARAEARRLVERARADAERLMDELDELRKQKNAAAFAAQAQEAKTRLRSRLRSVEDSIDPVAEKKRDAYVLPRPLKAGDEVRLADIDKTGVVLSPPDSSGNVEVQAGIIRTRVPVENLRLITGKKQMGNASPYAPPRTRNVSSRQVRSAETDLDLRGLSIEEALLEADQFIDNAVMSGLETITLIHGKGTGALRTAIQQHLRSHPSIKSYRLGTYGEGENGVTIAELK